jgi:hypothetical protein
MKLHGTEISEHFFRKKYDELGKQEQMRLLSQLTTH